MELVNRKESIQSIVFFILISSAFISIHILPVNPAYILGLIPIFLSMLYINFKEVDKFALMLFIYFSLSLSFFYIGIEGFKTVNANPNYQSSFLYLFCIILGFSTILIGSNIKKKYRLIVYRCIANFLILFLLVDLVSRFAFGGNSGSFYDYKFGPFYLDSNFTGNILLCFLMFYYFLYKQKILNIGFFRFSMLILLLIGTFSRAAIFSFILSYFLFNLNQRYRTIVLSASAILGVILIYKMISFYLLGGDFMGVDPSFNSKFALINIAIDNYDKLPILNKFFGIGLNNFSYYSNGMFAHNFFITFFYEFGFFGIFLFSLLLCYFYINLKSDSLYLIFPFLLCSFSLFSAYMPFFFVIMSCIYLEKKY
ncbi:O-antigen polymerase [Acinetobacter bereziniae]|uniref:O-antigen polymerase n=1 Tax=Acinetobacter bereziniae TaxID=106648 RepID=UPI0015D9984B|nr:O-antigen polymerase [Acinetobacter bereziniae]